MKMIAFFATVLLAGTASATVYHDYDAALRGITVDNACITATTVETINNVRHCTKLEAIEHVGHGEGATSHTEWVCTNWETTKQIFPRDFSRTVCTDYVKGHGETESDYCRATGQKADFLPASINIRTTRVISQEQGEDWPGVSSVFTFPTCK